MDPIALATGFLLGVRHCLDPDHIAAVSQFASADPRPRRGLLFGLLWGAGHGAAVLAVAGLVLATGLRFDGPLEGAGERIVGVVLVVVGGWRLASLFSRRHEHAHAHPNGVVHTHPHAHGPSHIHVHGSAITGLVHGLAGAAGVLALLPLAVPAQALGLALAFVLGSFLGMGVFGTLASGLFAGAAVRRGAWLQAASGVAAVAAMALGVVWLARPGH